MIELKQYNASKFGTQFMLVNKSLQKSSHKIVKLQKSQEIVKQKQTQKEKCFFKIIVPNYNNMPYIKHCLDSILEQTFKDFKIIVVDDISTDGSDKFCEVYSRKYPNKIVYHQLLSKGYAGAARNWAIDYPLNSEYTLFVDSDDYIFNNNVLNSLHDFILSKNKPMLIRASMIHYYGKLKPIRKDKLSIKSKTRMYRDGPGPGRTIISSKLKYKFIENRSKSNDCIWFLRCIDKLQLNQIALYDKPWYIYNRASITSCQNNEKKINSLKCIYDSTIEIINDLKNEKFIDMECEYLKQFEIQRRSEQLNKNQQLLKLINLFLNSYVIVCSNNEYKNFCSLFSSYEISPLPQPFIGCTDPKLFSNSWRIRQSHINLVKYAKNKNLPYVLIFESDAYPCINILEKLAKYVNFIPNNANLVLLGWTKIRNKQKYNQPFTKITNEIIDGAHSYILFNKAYDIWLYLMETRKSQNSNDNYIYPADNFIFNDIQNAYVIDYPLFIQFNNNKSIHGHIAYNFNGCSNIAPKGFK